MLNPVHHHISLEVVVEALLHLWVHERPALNARKVRVVVVLLEILVVLEYALALLVGCRSLCILFLKVLNCGTGLRHR